MKTEHKRIYLERIMVPSLREEGFGNGIMIGNELKNMDYMRVSEIQKEFRRRRGYIQKNGKSQA